MTCWLHVYVKAENVMMDIYESSLPNPPFPIPFQKAISPKEQTFHKSSISDGRTNFSDINNSSNQTFPNITVMVLPSLFTDPPWFSM